MQHPGGRLVVYCTSAKHREILRGNPYIDSLRLMTKWPFSLDAFPFTPQRLPQNLLVANYSRLAPGLYRIPAARLIGEMLGVTVQTTTPEFYLTSAEDAQARERLGALRIPVAIHTTPLCSPNKRWPREHWERLIEDSPEYDFVQVDDRDEPAVAGAHDLRGLPIRECFALIKHARAFIGVESGPAHAAAAVGVPSIVLFGPSTPEVWGHVGATHLSARPSCSPCIDTLYSGECPYERRCMSSIAVSAVKNSLISAVGNRLPSPVNEDVFAASC